MRSLACLLPILLVAAACADTPDTDDAAAEAAPFSDAAKADAPSFDGMYRAHATSFRSGDIPAMQLAGGQYVRSRCYHTNCALKVSETDRYDYYTSSGKTYVRFWSFDVWRDADGNLVQDPHVADVYEIRSTTTGIKLRKSYTSRWVYLYPTTANENCTASGGSFGPTGCECPANIVNNWPDAMFVAGAGGCVHNPGSNESNCDDSDGLWTDDDAAANGTFCLCGYGRYLDDSGSCSAI